MHEADQASAPPRVLVNGAPHPWRNGLTVADVLRELDAEELRVATSLNGLFVARSKREATGLAPDDRLSVFTAIVGG